MRFSIQSVCLALVCVSLLSIVILATPQKKTANPAPATPGNNKPITKKPSVIRFGIVGAGGESIPDAQVQAANAQLMQMLGGEVEDDDFEAVLLQSKLDVMIRQEAKKKECDYILFVKELTSTIGTAPASSNPFNSIKENINKAIEIVPNSKLKSQTTYEAQSTVSKTADLLNNVSKGTKKKDRVSLKFSLVAVKNGAEVIADTTKEKIAAKNGEDILGGVLVEVGNLVLNASAK